MRAESIKKKPEGTRMIHTAPTTPLKTVPFSFLPLSANGPVLVSALLLSRFWSVQVSVSLYYCNHHVCKNLCWVSRARLCRLFRSASLLPVFHEREGARPLIVTFVFYVSNLSWNTNDETLRHVRLIIFFGSACVTSFLILSSPPP
jgi:hypothetical protein